jgi:hypothetical protein
MRKRMTSTGNRKHEETGRQRNARKRKTNRKKTGSWQQFDLIRKREENVRAGSGEATTGSEKLARTLMSLELAS